MRESGRAGQRVLHQLGGDKHKGATMMMMHWGFSHLKKGTFDKTFKTFKQGVETECIALLYFIAEPHCTSDEKAEKLSQKLLRMGTNFNR